MSANRSRTLYGVIVVLVALLVIASSIAGLYYVQYTQELAANSTYVQQLKAANVTYNANLLLDYGNGTRTWFNNTKVLPGTNVYIETQIVTGGRINATWYPQYSSHFVTAIFNVGSTSSLYWLLYTYNKTAAWQQAPVGPDGLQAYNNSVYVWIYCGSNCTAP
jgi:hypothetical protein